MHKIHSNPKPKQRKAKAEWQIKALVLTKSAAQLFPIVSQFIDLCEMLCSRFLWKFEDHEGNTSIDYESNIVFATMTSHESAYF